MSSHREAPEIAKDPVADSTDLYAFVSPDAPGTVTLIANYVPLQGPAGGPNFFEFGDDVLYRINISHSASILPDVTYEFRFTTQVRDPKTFLYNTGQITSLDDPNFNRRQFYTVTRTTRRGTEVLGKHLASPPCNVGPRSIPDYPSLAAAPPLQPRAAPHPPLPLARRRRDPHAARPAQGLRRAARRRLLRRPRVRV